MQPRKKGVDAAAVVENLTRRTGVCSSSCKRKKTAPYKRLGLAARYAAKRLARAGWIIALRFRGRPIFLNLIVGIHVGK